MAFHLNPFNNPDKKAWYRFGADEKGALYANEAEAMTGGATEFENIHGKFVS